MKNGNKKIYLKAKSYKLTAVVGFSIIELMVVISIIGIMSSLMFANYRQGERDTALEYAAQQIAQDIRQAQNLSLAGPINTYGYGIYFDKNKESEYFIYGDEGVQNANHQYEGDEGNDKKVIPYLIVLPTNIEINNITVSPVGDVADIFFAPPDPITYINGVSGVGTAEIEICFTTISKCKTIVVTTAGRVEVE
ncbi:prepilin-type N-terminal cleavage/methylation domain-containing protein [Candidatus Kuenenbacteria bacterium]|nr:prepilin-type N-terminal cleavage/methylation domain-containing protein [Candidatus Kuenenbacteria bacterium]